MAAPPPTLGGLAAKTKKEKKKNLEGVHKLMKLTDAVAKYDGRTREGVVIRCVMEEGGVHRSKLKGDDHKRLYKLQDSCTEQGIWRAVRAGSGALQMMRKNLPPQFSPYFETAVAEIMASAGSVLTDAHRAVVLGADGDSSGRALALYLRSHTQWSDGSDITEVQRKLAYRALAGRLSAPAPPTPDAGSESLSFPPPASPGESSLGELQRRPLYDLDYLDHSARHSLFMHVPVPVVTDGLVCTADGVRLLNHRRA